MTPVSTGPVTGIASTSGKLTVVGLVAGILAVILPHQAANQPTPEVMATTIVGGVTVVTTIVAKLWHDIQHRKIAAVGGDVAGIVKQVEALIDPLRQAYPELVSEVNKLKSVVTPGTPAAPAPTG